MRALFGAVIVAFVLAAGGHAQPNASAAWLGMNLEGIADWGTLHPFVDAFRTSRAWISQRDGANWGEGGPLALAPEGWVAELAPGQFAETLLFSAEPSLMQGMDGIYTVLYSGSGQIAFRGGNVTVLSEAPGRMSVDVRLTAGPVFLQIIATDPADPLRDIRFLMPGAETTYAEQPFNPVFLERMRPFRVLRFMDWMRTNNSPIVTAADWPQLSDANYAERGVPGEVRVQLANTLGADAGFIMPHMADDEAVRVFAERVRDGLNPALKVYVEYSNETWNGQFDQAYYVRERGSALDLAPGDDFLGGLRYHARRAGEIFAIWESVFGGSERLVRVIASQAANNWTGEQIAEFEDTYQRADALAIAPYFSCDDPANADNAEAVLAAGLDALLAQQLANVQDGGCAIDYITANLEIARRFDLELVAYEGGQHLAGYGGTENNDALTALFIAANRAPRMGDVYREFLRQWRTLGGGRFVAFASTAQPTQFGSWGVLETIQQDPATAPKYQALLDALATLP